MVISADTSFLFSLYGNDSHTPLAVSWLSTEADSPIHTGPLADFELRNSLRFSECRRYLSPGLSHTYLLTYESALSSGRVKVPSMDLAAVLAESRRLSSLHTLTGGHRSFDILHVASALLLGATHFLTFHSNQKTLAETEGLIVPF